MRVAVTGAGGQLGSALTSSLSLTDKVIPLRHSDFDLTDMSATHQVIRDIAPDIVVHCAAMTNVDACAENSELAYRVNAIGTQNVALACAACNATILYISSNEVFDGLASEPYREWDTTHPCNPYGHSKLGGEWFVCHLLTRFYIVRTAWLFARDGHNFAHRILDLANKGEALRVVSDEIGNPTYVPDLVNAIAGLIRTEAYGVYHLTNSGFCSRYGFAREILHVTGRENISIHPITLDEFQRASIPPHFGALANTVAAAHGITLRPWQESLREFLVG